MNDATETHYQVEILAKLKKISIEKAKTKLAGDNLGSLTADGQRPTQEHNQALLLSQATPYMQVLITVFVSCVRLISATLSCRFHFI